MSTDIIDNKTIDESVQGQAYFDENAVFSEKKFYIESYGCAMNFNDSEIVGSILAKEGYAPTRAIEEADLLLMNTCSIREKAEDTVRKRLRYFSSIKKKKEGSIIGVLGCMAERLKTKLLEDEKIVDMVLGPDAYRDLPNLLAEATGGQRGINVLLSREETYADINPLRLDQNGISSFISIMRGCDNMCSFCVVPFTRGRERSRNAFTIVAEAQDLADRGYKEVTLLGQNVDSYKWVNPETNEGVTFAQLMVMVAQVSPELRVRFSTSHPKDITDDVLFAIRDHENICNYIHLPAQSGNSRVLELMNRTYDIEWYKQKVDRIYEIIPDCSISSDFITGFCSETEEEHQDTLDLIEYVNYSMSFMFFYSERPGTLAARKYEDDIPLETKKRRLNEVIAAQRKSSEKFNKRYVNNTYKVLVEGPSKKSPDDFKGKNSQNQIIIFPHENKCKKGDYVNVHIYDSTGMTAFGKLID